MTDIAICIPMPEYEECVSNDPNADCMSRGCFGNEDKTLFHVIFMIDGTHASSVAQDYSFNPCFNFETYDDTVCNKTSWCDSGDGFEFDTNLLTFDFLGKPLVVDVRYDLVGCEDGSHTSLHATSPGHVSSPVSNANAVGWHDLKLYSEAPAQLKTTELQDLAYASWYEMQEACPGIPELRGLDVDFAPLALGVLASASRTMVLVGGVWESAIHYPSYSGTTMVIRVNSNVPNGWFMGKGCNTGWRYDLRTVIKHELLHGLGITSSIYANSVGFMSGDKCYVTKLDSMMVSNGAPLLKGCEMRPLGEVHIGGTRIFSPSIFNGGSSFSHHWHEGLLSWNILPMTCYDLGYHEFNLLQSIGVKCNKTLDRSVSGASRTASFYWVGSALFLLTML
jgi:hypothetical protein|tara:strand:+ start:1149 stop:2327 length:1179 start_codon:yes stop_codon:yes gene_type:complete